jgi:hypothetical protein
VQGKTKRFAWSEHKEEGIRVVKTGMGVFKKKARTAIGPRLETYIEEMSKARLRAIVPIEYYIRALARDEPGVEEYQCIDQSTCYAMMCLPEKLRSTSLLSKHLMAKLCP